MISTQKRELEIKFGFTGTEAKGEHKCICGLGICF